jgi:hypothetical protein
MRWRVGNTLFVISAAGHPPEVPGYIGKEEMVKIAESMYPDSLAIRPNVFKTVADAEAATGMNILEPLTVPDKFTLKEVIIPEGLNCAILMYKDPSRIFRINQNARACGPRGNEVGASAEIIPVKLNWGNQKIDAEFVIGEWISTAKDRTEAEGATTVTEQSEWRNDVPFRRLRWEIDGVIYEIYAVVEYSEMQEMIAVAESMYPDSLSQADGGYKTVEDAEKASGLDVPELTNIPQDYALTKVIVTTEGLTQLWYQSVGDSLTFTSWVEGDGVTTDIGKSAEVIPLKIQWKGREITGEYVAGGWIEKSRTEQKQALKWDSTLPFQTLRWTDGERKYEIVHSWSVEHSGFDLDEMIDLAENVR